MLRWLATACALNAARAKPETPALDASATSETRQLLGQICYTLTGTDTYGDGWNGGHWTWADASGAVVAVGTVTHNTATEALCLDATAPCYTFTVRDAVHNSLHLRPAYPYPTKSTREPSSPAPAYARSRLCMCDRLTTPLSTHRKLSGLSMTRKASKLAPGAAATDGRTAPIRPPCQP